MKKARQGMKDNLGKERHVLQVAQVAFLHIIASAVLVLHTARLVGTMLSRFRWMRVGTDAWF